MTRIRAAWDAWMALMERFGHFVSRYLVVPILYVVLGAIFTLPTRAGDPLRLRFRRGESHWQPRAARPDGLDRAREMH